MSKRKPPLGKLIRPRIWVFCEGETERAYVEYLRAKYRIPMEIVAHTAGSNISERYINKYMDAKQTHPKDRVLLLYDADVVNIVERLKTISGAQIILSNPCIELWFLLHFKHQKSAISESKCIHEIENRTKVVYKKGTLSKKLLERLNTNCSQACRNAAALLSPENPSTDLYVFIEMLEQALKD